MESSEYHLKGTLRQKQALLLNVEAQGNGVRDVSIMKTHCVYISPLNSVAKYDTCFISNTAAARCSKL